MKVTKELRNDLLKRKELVIDLVHKGNPGIQYCVDKVSTQYKVEPAVIIVKKINSSFGSDRFSVEVFVYDTEKDLKETEPKKKEKKK